LCFLTSISLGQDWSTLQKYDKTITSNEFCRLIDRVYNPSKVVYQYLTVTTDHVDFFSDTGKTNLDLSLRFIRPGKNSEKIPRTFKAPEDLKILNNSTNQPLKGVKIVLDPGHIGGTPLPTLGLW